MDKLTVWSITQDNVSEVFFMGWKTLPGLASLRNIGGFTQAPDYDVMHEGALKVFPQQQSRKVAI